jgi:MFS family permease
MRLGPSWRATFAPFRSQGFTPIYTSGLLFSIVRWGLGFLGAYVVNDLTASPRLVQLTGALMWAPPLFAGILGGAISDRLNRRRTILAVFLVTAPLSVFLGVAAILGELRTWMIFPSMLVVGVGWVIDITVRRPLVYDVVPPEQRDRALALEMFSTASGLAFGSLIGGATIEFLGVGEAYLVLAVILAGAAALIARVPLRAAAAPPTQERFLTSIALSFRALPSNQRLVSILGVTVVANFFYFAYAPIVQVIGERVGATPFLIGVLAGSAGIGMMLSSLWVAMANPHRGRTCVFGTLAAMVFLLGFALFESYPLVLLSLFASSFCFGLYGATQSALTMTSVPDPMRGRAMGLLTMAIGSLPIGMAALGELAESVGASESVVAFNLAGIVALCIWIYVRPESFRTP